jgi:co-chaperonin GroES (HSP10)
MKLRPLHDRVVIRRVDEAGTDVLGVIEPTAAAKKAA